MKAKPVIFSCIFIFAFSISSGQAIKPSSSVKKERLKSKNIYGSWNYEKTDSNGTLIYKRKSVSPHFGHYLSFSTDGSIIVGRSTQCGNDMSKFMHFGTWTLDYKTMILKTSQDILNKGTTFKIIKVSPTELHLKATKEKPDKQSQH